MKYIHTFILFFICIKIAGCKSSSYIEGTVIDYDTSEPIPDTKVSVNQIGWGFVDGRVVWDKLYVTETNTDNKGEFTIEYSVGSSAHLKAFKEGYSEYSGYYANDSTITVKLKKKKKSPISLEHGVLRIGIENFRPYGWIFSEKKTTFKAEEADIFPKFDENFDRENLVLETYGRAGITFLSEKEIGVSSNFLIYTDMAPVEGYSNSITFEIDRFNGVGGVYFIRTSDGAHFAKFSFDPSSYTTIGSEQDFERGTWGLLLEYVYNPDGTKNLTFQR